MTDEIQIIMPEGALGAYEGEGALTSELRRLALAVEEYLRTGGWVDKYGIAYENQTFMMHPYCWCDEDDCPWCNLGAPNFHYYPKDFQVYWYKYIGRGMEANYDVARVSDKADEIHRIFGACRWSLRKDQSLKARVRWRDYLPKGTLHFEFRDGGWETLLYLSTEWPSHVAPTGDEDNPALACHMATVAVMLRHELERVGAKNIRFGHSQWQRRPTWYNPAYCFPPMGMPGDEEHDQYARQSYRPMSGGELAEFRQREGRDPFSDEYWICLGPAGINAWVSFWLPMEPPGEKE